MVVYRNGVDLEVTLTSSMRNSKIYSVSATEHQLHSAHETNYSKPKKSFGRKVRDELRRAERKVRRLIPMSVRNGYRSLRSVMKTGRVSFRTFSESRTSQKDLLQDSHHMKEILQQQIETVQAKFSSLNCRFQEQLQQVRKNLENRHSAHQQEIARVQKQILQLQQQVVQAHHQIVKILPRIESFTFATAQRVAIPVDEGNILLHTNAGYLLCKSSEHAILANLLDSGDLERGTRLLLTKVLERGSCFIDVGAHIGMHTLAAAQKVGHEGRVVSFEPCSANFNLLQKSLCLREYQGFVTVHNAAVSKVPGKSQLHLARISGYHSLFPIDETASADAKLEEVNVVTLDQVLPSDVEVSIIKIDAEGSETDILEGAKQTLSRNPDVALIVEYGPSHLRRVGQSSEEWFKSFSEFGMVFKVIEAYTGKLVEADIESLKNVYSENLLFARPNSPVWSKAV